jgi:2-oxoglutarate dehydrogenase E2 component (dihydrolipoamide succinyltransferase)
VYEIRVPRLNTNDEQYTVVQWLVADGEEVAEEAPVVVVETAKAAEELATASAGILARTVPEGAVCPVGAVVAMVFASPDEREEYQQRRATPWLDAGPAACGGDIVVTEPARALAERYGIDQARLRSLDQRVIRAEDVARLAAGDEASARLELPPGQAAVAAVVARSHATIPASFVAARVLVDDALVYARTATRRLRTLVGLTELVVQAIAGLGEQFPLFVAGQSRDGGPVRADGIHIGVTMDVGRGLTVPVVRDAGRRSLGSIAEQLLELRRTAMTGSFRPADLAGATIVLALANEPEVVLSQPIVFPGTVCAVSLPGVQTETVIDANAGPRTRSYVDLGIAFDHRVVNGRDAVLFLRAVKAGLENLVDP